MNVPLLLAALLSLMMLFAHWLSVEDALLIPMAQSNLSTGLQVFITALWQGLTAILAINTTLLALSAFRQKNATPIAAIIALQYFAYSILFFGYGLAKFGNVTTMSQWIAGLVICAFCTWGIVKNKSKSA